MKVTGSSFIFPCDGQKAWNKEKEHSQKGKKKWKMRGKIILTDDYKIMPNPDFIHSLSGREVSPIPFWKKFRFPQCALSKQSYTSVKYEALKENSEELGEITGKEKQLFEVLSCWAEFKLTGETCVRKISHWFSVL